MTYSMSASGESNYSQAAGLVAMGGDEISVTLIQKTKPPID